METPYSNLTKAQHANLATLNSRRPPIEPKWPKDIQQLLTSGWNRDPSKRPTMKVFHEKLHDILNSLQEPKSKRGFFSKRPSSRNV